MKFPISLFSILAISLSFSLAGDAPFFFTETESPSSVGKLNENFRDNSRQFKLLQQQVMKQSDTCELDTPDRLGVLCYDTTDFSFYGSTSVSVRGFALMSTFNAGSGFLLNQNTLQSGSTFYTASGTIAGQLKIDGGPVVLDNAYGIRWSSNSASIITDAVGSSMTIRAAGNNAATFLPSRSFYGQLPGVALTKDTNQGAVSGSTTTLYFGGTEIYDTDNYHTNTASDTITVPSGLGGTYWVGCHAIASNNVANFPFGLQILTCTGSSEAQPSISCNAYTTDPFQVTGKFSCDLSAVVTLADNCSITCRVAYDSGANITIQRSSAFFRAIRIGP